MTPEAIEHGQTILCDGEFGADNGVEGAGALGAPRRGGSGTRDARVAGGLDQRGVRGHGGLGAALVNVAPHVAAKAKGSAIDGRTTRHAGYRTSQVIRKRIEEVFGWGKAAASLRKTRHRGLGRVGWQFTFTLAAYNLIRLPKLLKAAA